MNRRGNAGRIEAAALRRKTASDLDRAEADVIRVGLALQRAEEQKREVFSEFQTLLERVDTYEKELRAAISLVASLRRAADQRR